MRSKGSLNKYKRYEIEVNGEEDIQQAEWQIEKMIEKFGVEHVYVIELQDKNVTVGYIVEIF